MKRRCGAWAEEGTKCRRKGERKERNQVRKKRNKGVGDDLRKRERMLGYTR